EGAAQPIVVSGQGRSGAGIAARRSAHDLLAGQRDTRVPRVVALEPRAGEPRLDTTALAAVARRTGLLVGREPRKRIVPPFAGNEVRAWQPAARSSSSTNATMASRDAA